MEAFAKQHLHCDMDVAWRKDGDGKGMGVINLVENDCVHWWYGCHCTDSCWAMFMRAMYMVCIRVCAGKGSSGYCEMPLGKQKFWAAADPSVSETESIMDGGVTTEVAMVVRWL